MLGGLGGQRAIYQSGTSRLWLPPIAWRRLLRSIPCRTRPAGSGRTSCRWSWCTRPARRGAWPRLLDACGPVAPLNGVIAGSGLQTQRRVALNHLQAAGQQLHLQRDRVPTTQDELVGLEVQRPVLDPQAVRTRFQLDLLRLGSLDRRPCPVDEHCDRRVVDFDPHRSLFGLPEQHHAGPQEGGHPDRHRPPAPGVPHPGQCPSLGGNSLGEEGVAAEHGPNGDFRWRCQFGCGAWRQGHSRRIIVLSWVKQCLEVGTAAKGPQGQLDVGPATGSVRPGSFSTIRCNTTTSDWGRSGRSPWMSGKGSLMWASSRSMFPG